MTSLFPPFLTEEEILFHRMETFHRQRVEMIANGYSPLGKMKDGVLVIHLIPQSSVMTRLRFEATKLIQAGNALSVFAENGRYRTSRFNVDGLLLLESEREPQSWTQIFRSGAVEAASSAITFSTADPYLRKPDVPTPNPQYLRDDACEKAVFQLVGDYCKFCNTVGIVPPVTMFSALIGCQGVQFHSQRGYSLSLRSVDRSPAFLPEIEIERFDFDPMSQLRPWCDTLFQAIGFEKSPNFDENGKWHERLR